MFIEMCVHGLAFSVQALVCLVLGTHLSDRVWTTRFRSAKYTHVVIVHTCMYVCMHACKYVPA